MPFNIIFRHFIFTEFSFDQNYRVKSHSDDKLCLCVFPLSVFCFRTRAYKSKKIWNQNILSISCGLTQKLGLTRIRSDFLTLLKISQKIICDIKMFMGARKVNWPSTNKKAKGTKGLNSAIYIVACQRGGVSEEPPWLRAATRHGPLTL